MVEVLARLYYLTGEEAYRERAAKIVYIFCGEDTQPMLAMPSLLRGYELLEKAVQTVIVGERNDNATQILLQTALHAPAPNRVLMQMEPDSTLPSHHPALGKQQIEKKATAYVCIGPTCSLPITDADHLLKTMIAAQG